MVCSVSTTDSSGQSDFETLQDDHADNMETAVVALLEAVGEDITREGLRETPRRVAKAWRDLLQGYQQNLDSAIGDAIFHLREGQQQRQEHSSAHSQAAPSGSVSGLVLVRDIDFTSISQSSLLPFCGRCHVAYLPRDGVVLGLSKFARLTVLLAKRLQSQQQLAAQILSVFVEHVVPHGAAVIIEATHLEHGPDAPRHISHAVHGIFGHQDDHHLQEILALLGIADSASSASMPGPDFLSSHGSLLPDHPSDSQHAGTSSSIFEQDHMLEDSNSASSSQHSPQHHHHHVMSFAQSASAPGWEDSCSMDEGSVASELAALPAQQAAIAQAVVTLLEGAGADPNLQGLVPAAVNYARLLLESTSGHHLQLPPASSMAQQHQLSVSSISASNPAEIEEIVLPFSSQCEHHILPFQGNAYLAYCRIPGAQQITRSKLEQLVAVYAKRLQIQERLNKQLADALLELSGGLGCMVVCRASHMCMVARGIEKHASSTVTTVTRGSFAEDAALRTELLVRLSSKGML
ncbi:hypothetical protein WJX74_001340 [Apatococcus lobatus]|uniref:GTP cyclohydrolase 1 n=1 Tax=Apatococcus lobatus TaxID=904363 RepID=A0AAW1RHR1_9CHLO